MRSRYITNQPRVDKNFQSLARRVDALDSQGVGAVLSNYSWLNLLDKPYADIRSFGAIEGGIADCTGAFSDAIATGLPVYVPPGLWLVLGIVLFSKSVIFGAGWSSIIKHKAGATDHLFTLADEDVYGVMLQDLKINGNKDNQTNPVDVINFDNTGGTFPEWDDPLHTFGNLFIYKPKRDGMYLGAAGTGTQGCYAGNVQIYKAGRHGFNIAGADNLWTGCIGGNCDDHCWNISEASSIFFGCRGYGAGVLASVDADGIHITSAAVDLRFLGLQGQENHRHGLCIDGLGGHNFSSVTLDHNAGDGLALIGGTQNNSFGELKCSENTGYDVMAEAGCTGNRVHVTVGDISKVYIGEAKNEIHVNTQEGHQGIEPSWAGSPPAATITPEPYYGSRIHVYLEGNLTINAPTARHIGMTMRFMLLQDASGSRDIILNSAYKTTWTPSKVANKYDVIEFAFDGTNWIELTSTVGVG